jgi:signal transduction histidine kinase
MGVVLTEPWSGIMAQAFYYQLVLVGLLVLGTVLCLGMLYLSLGRVIRPIAVLAENASGAIPGSVFHPIPENGPREIRTLINAFNQMVIRLAEQQSTLRQYAHKALLSQEDERQRLSHELHDGTVQDLVGLAQRVELCRSELDSDPQLARRRLDELQKLLEQTLTDVRRISIALRPPVLEDFGLSIALDALCKDLQQEKPALRCDYILSGKARRLAPELELAVYRVVQEALANVRKHAQDATRVQVEERRGSLHQPGRARLRSLRAHRPGRHVRARQPVRRHIGDHFGCAGKHGGGPAPAERVARRGGPACPPLPEPPGLTIPLIGQIIDAEVFPCQQI